MLVPSVASGDNGACVVGGDFPARREIKQATARPPAAPSVENREL